MKVFISWSGDRSKRVAVLLDEWLECVIQSLDPWVSSKDIDRGSLWFSEISDQLANTTVGIVCLTKENKDKPWILFESGALAKGLSSNRVCTFLIDLKPTDLKDPLAQFNHTLPDRDGLWALVRTINSSLGDSALKPQILEKVFDTYWLQFDKSFKEILKETVEAKPEEKRDENDILIEVLSAVRSMEKRIRYVEDLSVNPSNINDSKTKTMTLKDLNAEIFLFIRDLRRNGLASANIKNDVIKKYGLLNEEAIIQAINSIDSNPKRNSFLSSEIPNFFI